MRSELHNQGEDLVVVAATKEAAIKHVKSRYVNYVVQWAEKDGMLIGHFGDKSGLCCKHVAFFEFDEYEVIEQ